MAMAVAIGLATIALVSYLTYASIGRLTHGFISYYTAARLLIEGQIGPQVYDDLWYRAEIQRRTASGVIDVFGPNPPTMALFAVPVAGLDAAPARTLWLLISLIALAGSTYLLARETPARRASVLPIAVALFLVSPPVLANLRTAQVYLVLGACFAGAAIALSRRRDAVAGICLGLAVILKTAGVPWLLVLAATRRWRALATALGTALLVALLSLPWIGASTWLVYPDAVTEFVARPSTAVTAYQTTVGFARHLCAPDAAGAPGLVPGCPTTATIAPLLLLGAAIAITIFAARQAPVALASAAGASLSMLCAPIAEDHQFVLLAVPLFALLAAPPRWAWLIVALLFLVPPQLSVQQFTAGWPSLLAYPRLYCAWFVWALTIGAIRRARAAGSNAPA